MMINHINHICIAPYKLNTWQDSFYDLLCKACTITTTADARIILKISWNDLHVTYNCIG